MRPTYSLKIAALMLLAAGLSGCASYDMSTPEGRAAYARDLAASQQTLQQSSQYLANSTAGLQQQAQQTQSPQVAPVQTNSTAVYACRDLTGQIVACKQVN